MNGIVALPKVVSCSAKEDVNNQSLYWLRCRLCLSSITCSLSTVSWQRWLTSHMRSCIEKPLMDNFCGNQVKVFQWIFCYYTELHKWEFTSNESDLLFPPLSWWVTRVKKEWAHCFGGPQNVKRCQSASNIWSLMMLKWSGPETYHSFCYLSLFMRIGTTKKHHCYTTLYVNYSLKFIYYFAHPYMEFCRQLQLTEYNAW